MKRQLLRAVVPGIVIAAIVSGFTTGGSRFFVSEAVAQPASDSEADLKNDLYPYYAREATKYEFFNDGQRGQKLALEERPVLTWTNAEKYMGAVFVWTQDGRPEVIGCIGSHQARPGVSNVFHEFHSLSMQPLQPVMLGGQREWRPTKAGVMLAAVEGAPQPSESEKTRLTQMRNIAREFRGAMRDEKDTTELRLVTQPIFRYKSAAHNVADGAIFALVWKGTDPEILLILEDRPSGGDNGWHYGLARFNWREMWVTRNDKEIWRVGISSQEDNYVTGMVGEVSLTEIRKTAPKAQAPN